MVEDSKKRTNNNKEKFSKKMTTSHDAKDINQQ